MNNLRRGNSDLEAMLILLVVISAVIFSAVNEGGKQGGKQSSELSNDTKEISTNEISIIIDIGSAPYAYQPAEEYIVIENLGAPVDITGWQVVNGKGKRVYDRGGSNVRFASDRAVIPQGYNLLESGRLNPRQNIVLGQYQRAIIITGKIQSKTPYQISSFRENICSGYLEKLPEYDFFPPLGRSCPAPLQESGIEGLSKECQDFIDSMPRCETPKYGGPNELGQDCTTCTNGQELSSSCTAFVLERYNYSACVKNHQNDEDFYGSVWRVFLEFGWELWANDHDTISVYDRGGRLIAERSY